MGQDPLAQLKELHLPTELESGLPALGVWLLISLGLILLMITIYLVIQRRKKQQAQRWYITRLTAINIKDPNALMHINQILKLAALHYFPRAQVAQLHGKHWLEFLDRQLKPNAQGFMKQEQDWLSLYQTKPMTATLEHLQQAHTWLRHALPPKKSEQSHV